MEAAARGEPYRIGFGGRLQMHYAPDAARAFVDGARRSEEGGALVANLGGPAVHVSDIVEAIEAAAPEAAGTITFDEAPLPFPEEFEGVAHPAPVTPLSETPSARRSSSSVPEPELYTAAVADVLDALGLEHQTLPPAIGPLRPGMRLEGPAFAVEGRPHPGHAYEPSIRQILGMLGDVPPGHVPVYATGDETCAQFGELSATALAAKGCPGVVLDGGTRDVAFIEATGFPVFCRYTTPLDSVPRWEAVAWGHEVEIGGVARRDGRLGARRRRRRRGRPGRRASDEVLAPRPRDRRHGERGARGGPGRHDAARGLRAVRQVLAPSGLTPRMSRGAPRQGHKGQVRRPAAGPERAVLRRPGTLRRKPR